MKSKIRNEVSSREKKKRDGEEGTNGTRLSFQASLFVMVAHSLSIFGLFDGRQPVGSSPISRRSTMAKLRCPSSEYFYNNTSTPTSPRISLIIPGSSFPL
jgi:hypothetical protein